MRGLFLLSALLVINPIMSPAAGQLRQMPIPELPDGQEMLVLEIEMAPGQASNPHRHNAHVFVYVLEGRVRMGVAGEEVQTLGPGETFYESPSDIHAVSANASQTEPARFLVHMLRTAGTPVSTPVPD